MFCGNEFGKFVTLLELPWADVPGAPVFVFAMSARALRMADVSVAGAPLAMAAVLPGCSGPFVKGMKSFGGLPGGVVDFTPTEERSESERMSFAGTIRGRKSYLMYLQESYRCLVHRLSP